MARVNKTEMLEQVDANDNIRINNLGAKGLRLSVSKPAALTRDEVVQLIAFLQAWVDHSEFEPTITPEPI
jgi:hypothetical protein